MAITTMASVKTLGNLYYLSGSGAPTTATVGALNDIYMDTATGLSYRCSAVNAGPPITYTWVSYTNDDAKITLFITKAENDYLKIRGIAFDTDENDAIEYPDGAGTTAAEMVCFLCSYDVYQGRGNTSESTGDSSKNYEKKIFGYPVTIVGSIIQYQSVQ